MPEASRPVLLFGAQGNLGSALRQRLSEAGHPVQAIGWQDVAAWFEVPDPKTQELQIRVAVERLENANLDILFAGGLTDPDAPESILLLSNTFLPQRVIAATRGMPGCRYLSFGSVLENFGDERDANAYLASKNALRRWILEQSETEPGLKGRIIHSQLHTLYGGRTPSAHLFLGQMIDALRHGRPFAMSTGRQLREYHHIEDIVGVVARLLESRAWPQDAVVPVSSGCPVQLCDLAWAIFAARGRSADLHIGQLAMAKGENLTEIFARSPEWLLGPSREPVAGVCDWIDDLLRKGDA